MTTIRLIKNNKKDINNTNNDMKNNDIYIYIMSFCCPGGPCTFFHNFEAIFVNRSRAVFNFGTWEGVKIPNFFWWICWIGLIHCRRPGSKNCFHPWGKWCVHCHIHQLLIAKLSTLDITPVTTVKTPKRPPTAGRTSLRNNGQILQHGSHAASVSQCGEGATKINFCWWFVFAHFLFWVAKGQKSRYPTQETRKHIPTKQGSFGEKHRRLKSAKVYGRGDVIVPRVGSVWNFWWWALIVWGLEVRHISFTKTVGGCKVVNARSRDVVHVVASFLMDKMWLICL